jgi:hypothetical protein
LSISFNSFYFRISKYFGINTTGSADIGTYSYVITCTVTATPVATSWAWTKTPIGGGTAVTINQGTSTNKYEVANN